MAKTCGWNVLASSCFLGSGATEPFGSAAGLLMANTMGDKFIAVRNIYIFSLLLILLEPR